MFKNTFLIQHISLVKSFDRFNILCGSSESQQKLLKYVQKSISDQIFGQKSIVWSFYTSVFPNSKCLAAYADIDFEPISAVKEGIPVSSEGKYQIIIRREDEVYTYPKSGPKKLTFNYDLSDEVQ